MISDSIQKVFSTVFLLCFLSVPAALHADTVIPIDAVRAAVNVREDATPDSEIVGKLRPGDAAELLGSVPWRYRVRLEDGTEGFVSKRWPRLVAAAPSANIPCEIHFIDVGTGDSAIVDMGDREIVIDGGRFVTDLHDYAARETLIQDPIELVIVTHGDSDHWKGLMRLLNLDGRASSPHTALEFWEPGYDRDCDQLDSYDDFIEGVRSISGIVVRRPLEETHAPSTATDEVASFTLESLPGVTFTLLHTSASPPASNGDSAYRINNASIVFMMEINGIRMLFSGDANGKERDDEAQGNAGHIEKLLLDMETSHPGTLNAHVLKVPHHGSETASTEEFIDAVDPRSVVISASTMHHLPKETVVERYENGRRVILRTDRRLEKHNDHIICAGNVAGQVDCNYKSVLEGN